MKTYLKLEFSSEGAKPSEVIKRLEELDWKPVIGEYDFVLEAGPGEGVGESFRRMLDKLQDALRGTNVRFTLYSTH
ncbi:MAG: hypothetical protein V1934_04030 [Methanobacteriota archaeon]